VGKKSATQTKIGVGAPLFAHPTAELFCPRRNEENMRFEGTSGYVASDDLKVAVNAAINLERPLLVKGEPGTGKTVLALEIAKALAAPLIE
jgi:MoxR-like ATPase